MLLLLSMFLMNALPNQLTDQPKDRAYYRDARTHLKRILKNSKNVLVMHAT